MDLGIDSLLLTETVAEIPALLFFVIHLIT